ncbi:MAG: WYL domain-containing protein [Nitrospirae bacterium]|nr:WYL domain-containing protein [Nitrospirota bacterium]
MARHPKKYSQVGRIEQMMRGLASRGWTIKELAQECEVSRRQVIRDLDRIAEGHPLEDTLEGGEKVYRLPLGYKGLPPIPITKFELMSLCLAKSHLEYLRGTPFLDDLDSVIGKVRVTLPDQVANHLQRILQIAVPLHRPNRHYGKQRDVIESLRRALLLQRRVVLSYKKPEVSKLTLYRFDPFALLLYKDGLYIKGWSHVSRELRTFAVERIQKVDLTDELFDISSSSPDMDQTFGIFEGPPETVRIRFKKDVAYLLNERQWHPTQKVTRLKNGAVLLHMRVGGMEELCSWILSWGPEAKVLAPPRLVKMVAEELQAAARQYPGR